MKVMDNSAQQSKVYLGIVRDIKEMIRADGLEKGDKIPSERELSERLKVGRSSVREALRSLELLGLIETRRGEGTFLCDFKNHQLINLLGMFILEDPNVKEDLIETRRIIEINILQHISSLEDKSKLQKLILQDNVKWEDVMELAHNRLLYRIWQIINNYASEWKQPDIQVDSSFLESILAGNIEKVLTYYQDSHRGVLSGRSKPILGGDPHA